MINDDFRWEGKDLFSFIIFMILYLCIEFEKDKCVFIFEVYIYVFMFCLGKMGIFFYLVNFLLFKDRGYG